MKTNFLFTIATIAAITTASLQKANAQNWLLKGNSGTNPSTNFLGTTDSASLILRTTNAERIRITGSGALNAGYVGVNVTSPVQRLDVGGNINIVLGSGVYINNRRVISTNGTANFFGGTSSGFKNTGSYNTGVGGSALYNNTGSYNTANGYWSLFNNATGNYNTAIGSLSLSSNNTGSYNTSNGYAALYSNTQGNENTAFGYEVLYSNATGVENTAAGNRALYNNKTGGYNTANGSFCLYFDTASYNTANGYIALYSNTNGPFNTANGYGALFSNTGGGENTATGVYALSTNQSGNYNTAIGSEADVEYSNLVNATAIGYGAIVDSSNKVRIGNTSIISIGGQVGWTTFSDGRYKKNIKEDVKGLQFINLLRPITYTIDISALNNHYDANREHDSAYNKMKAAMQTSTEEASKIVYNGFIAQEVESAAQKLHYDFSGVDKPKSGDGLYGLRYSDFVVPLVKAVQELSKQNDSLKERLDKIEQMLAANNVQQGSVTNTVVVSNATLYQNSPNPFSNTTTINYTIPAGFKTAQVVITDINGKTIKQVQLNNAGKGALNINAYNLSNGSYNYSLIVDGRMIESRKMVVGK